MKNQLLKSFIVLSIVAANCQYSLAHSEASNEANSEAPMPAVGSTESSPASQVNQSIQQTSELSSSAKNVNVENKDGAVVIKGSVPTDGDKQKINSLAERTGAQNVRNEVKVENSGTTKNKVIPKARVITPKYNH